MNLPRYMELYEQMKRLISEGHYQEGMKLPSKRKLAESLKISPLTVEAAYGQLIAEGYVYAIEKKGYFVREQVDLIEPDEKVTFSFEPEERLTHHDRYRFQTNVVDTSLFPHSTWKKLSREVLSENYEEMLNVVHPQGVQALRVEIAKYLNLYRGISVHPSQIIIGSGSTSLIGLIVEMIGRHKTYAIENPSYPKIYHLFKSNDVKLHPIDLDDFGINMHSIKQIGPNVIHVTPSHQFPMGITMPIQRRNELINYVSSTEDRWIIEDDYDSEFRYQGKPIPALKSLDYHDRVIYMNTFTKTLAPSFRMSYMVLPQKLLKVYQMMSSYHGCTVPNFEQYIMTKFMSGGYFERHINRMRHHYREKLEILMRVTAHLDAIELIGHEAGLHLVMAVKRDVSGEALVDLAKAHDIEVSCVEHYNHLPDFKTKYPMIVIGYSGIPKDEVESAVIDLMKAWKFI